ncbi:MAG: LamG-like jellyroll fold domain-containing protein [Planctomycetota bacterium]|jgi:hypothetical protein
MSKKLYFLMSLVLVLGLAGSTLAQEEKAWTDGGGDHLWCNPDNWDGGELPEIWDLNSWSGGSAADIDTEAMADPVQIVPGCDAEAIWIHVGKFVDVNVGLVMTGGTLTSYDIITGSRPDSAGTMIMSGGTIYLKDWSFLDAGDAGSGTIIMTGGEIYANGTNWDGSPADWPGSVNIPKNERGDGTGHLQLDGGTIWTRHLNIGDRGTMDITGGTMSIVDYVDGGDTQDDVLTYLGDYIADGNLTAYDSAGIVGVVVIPSEDTNEPNGIWIAGRLDLGAAWLPMPVDGAVDVTRDVVLSWQPGDYVQSTNGHKVYFADNFVDVDSRAGGAYKGAQTDITYDAGQLETLELSKTYYWAVDEVNGATTWPGDVWSFRVVLGIAQNPYPADGSDEIPKDVVLNWMPGSDANSVKGHDVYFGTDYDDVNDANKLSSEYRGTQDANSWGSNNYAPTGLDLVTTYYWRIDEVNGTDRWKGDVWSFEVEGRAKNPYPANGGRGVPSLELVLRWEAGTDAASHDVYFGSSKSAVSDANTATAGTFRVNQALSDVNYLVPEDLDVRKTYYWRIDEVNNATLKGHVWSFTTGPFLVVDSFEWYPTDEALKAVWKDYWVDTASKNGCQVFVETDPNFVHGGEQSMKFWYKNYQKTGGKYVGSWATAATSDLEFTGDWTRGGVKALVTYFLGDPCNGKDTTSVDQDLLWVALDDGSTEGVVPYDGDMSAVTEDWWHEWNVSLQDFNDAGVVMSSIANVWLGSGGYAKVGQSAAGAGMTYGFPDTVYFDDIRLYPPRCLPEATGLDILHGLGDITEDCNTNYLDLTVMARDWNMRGLWAQASMPDINAVVEYLFNDGSGSTIVTNTGDYNDPNYDLGIGMGWDSNGNPSAEPNNDPCWLLDADANRGWTLSFDGNTGWSTGGDYLVIPPLNFDPPLVTATITAWVKPHPHLLDSKKGVWGQEESFTGLVHSRNASSVAGLSYGSGSGFSYDGSLGYVWSDNDSDTWGFETNIFIPDWKWSFLAVVIEPDKATCYIGDPNGTLRTAVNPLPHIGEEFDGRTIIAGDENSNLRFFSGQMDDVRIYDAALSAGDVLGLAEIPGIVYVPLSSPADMVVGDKEPCYPDVDDQIDFADYAAMAKHWLEKHPWP